MRDEITGAVTEVRQKFRADKLQVSYQAWADRFGLTKRMAQDAFTFLKRKGLVTIEMRTVEIGGVRTPNVVFIEPVYQAIAEITGTGGITLKHDISPGRTGHISHREGTRLAAGRETYTKNNTKTSVENTHAQKRSGARVSEGSRYSLAECRAYAEHMQKTRQGITNPGGYATIIFRSGEADLLIEEFFKSPVPPEAIDTSKCPDCEGRGMWYPEGMDKGAVAKCQHKRLTMILEWIRNYDISISTILDIRRPTCLKMCTIGVSEKVLH